MSLTDRESGVKEYKELSEAAPALAQAMGPAVPPAPEAMESAVPPVGATSKSELCMVMWPWNKLSNLTAMKTSISTDGEQADRLEQI